MNLLLSLHEHTWFMGFPLSMIWLPIVIGIIIGIYIPLNSIARKILHFTVLPFDGQTSERDVDAIKKLLPDQKRSYIKSFCITLRRLGLTLHVER